MVRGPYLPKNFQIQKIMIVWGQKVNFGLKVKMAAVAWLSVIAKQGVHVMVPFKVIRMTHLLNSYQKQLQRLKCGQKAKAIELTPISL